jgi:methionine-rich copper-binding protein CopC
MPSTLRPAALALLVAATAGFGLFHNRLVKSTPAKDAVVAAPTEVRLWFEERAEPGLSSITIVGSDSSKVATGKVKATDDRHSVAVDVTGPMKPGGYLVRWRTSGTDGHVIKGSFPFTVK